MKLPGGHHAVIPIEKISGYLLSESHAVGRAKARFFHGLGYRSDEPDALIDDLATIAASEQISEVVETAHGTKYIVDSVVETPSGANAGIRTVWIIEPGVDAPRFVTAYPVD